MTYSDGKVIAAGNGWVSILPLNRSIEMETIQVGLNVTAVAAKKGIIVAGTMEGRLLVIDEGRITWSTELGSPIFGLSWGPYLVVGTNNGKVFKVVNYERLNLEEIATLGGVNDLKWSPKGDEFAVADNVDKSLTFFSVDGKIVAREYFKSIPIKLDYSPTVTEVAVILESGELVTIGTPKVINILKSIVEESKCEERAKILCKALEKALWEIITELGNDVPIDDFLTLRNLGPKLLYALPCLLKHLDVVKKILKDLMSMEDIVEALKDGCDNFEKWLDSVSKNSLCIKKVSNLLIDLMELSPSDLLPAQIPTSVALVEKFGCEKALEIMECVFALALLLKDLKKYEDDLGIKLPNLTEMVLYVLLKDNCEELLSRLKEIAEIKEKVESLINEGRIVEVFDMLEEAKRISEDLKNVITTELPDGFVGI